MENKDPSLFLFLAICNPKVKAETVEKEFWQQIEKIKKEGIKQEELDKVKINTKADFIFGMQNSSNLADLFGSYFAKGDIKPLLEYEDNINKLKTDDIVEVAKKYFTKDNSTTIILRKEEK
jgi:predicted Zn-dependent peptidase